MLISDPWPPEQLLRRFNLGVAHAWRFLRLPRPLANERFRYPYANKKGAPPPANSAAPQTATKTTFSDYFSSTLPPDAPHDAALQPKAVLRSAAKVRVQVLELDRSQRHTLRQCNVGPAARCPRKGIR